MLLSSTGLRRYQPQMQEHIDLLLVHDVTDYTRVTKILSVNHSNRQTLSLNRQQHARCMRSHRKLNQREREREREREIERDR